ncbi:hypothetical protein KAH81_01265 [bacterium]|nr:hypothetical protein [bacterium]
MRAVVGAVLGEDFMRVIILDPPCPSTGSGNGDADAEPMNLTAKLVAKVAKAMRASIQLTPTQPTGTMPVGVLLVGACKREGTRPSPTEPPAQIETIFRGPRDATGATREIKLTKEFKEDKGHGWLEKR